MLFAVPFHYLFHSRLRWRSERISWILINPVPIFALSAACSALAVGPFLLLFVLGFVAWQAVYEIGYIENDVVTTKREAEPTLRLSPQEAAFVERRLGPIAAARIAIACLALGAVAWVASAAALPVNLVAFAGILAASRIVFLFHNRLRNRFNILTFGLLSAAKYSALPVLLAADGNLAWSALAALAIFPVVRTIEHATKNKYGFPRLKSWVGDFATFRVKYYFIAALAFLGAAAALSNAPLYAGSAILLYLLLYRAGVWLAMKRKLVQARRHSAYE